MHFEPLEQRRLLSGVPLGGDFLVNSHTLLDQQSAAIAADPAGNFIVAWQSQDQDGSGQGIYAQRFGADGVPQGGEFRVNSYTTGDQTSPALDVDDDGNFVIAWRSEDQDGSEGGIYAQRYNAAGGPLGGEFRVNTQTAGDQAMPAVAVDPTGDFVVAWQSYDADASGFGVVARRFDAVGVPEGDEFLVNTGYTSFDQSHPDVAIAADGSFVVVWQSSFEDGSSWGVYGQRYDAGGGTLGGAFQINTYTTSFQRSPAVAMNDEGDFVVAWFSVFQDGSFDGIFARPYGADGTPQSGEFQVNTFTTGQQNEPDVAIEPDGDFVVIWQSDGQDGDGYGIYAQCFTVAGLPKGEEFRVNSVAENAQVAPAVAMDADGDFVAAWHSYDQDGSGTGIYARRFEAAAAVVGRQVFYNQSSFDGFGTAINASDDNAIAPDKSAYLPGSGLATFDNITSYSRGINGIMIDVAGAEGPLGVDDFTFKMSAQTVANNMPSLWQAAPAPSGFSVRPGEGAGGSDRVVVVWAAGAITNRWLEVVVEGNDAAGGNNTNTGLAQSDRFYFGNRVGDAGSGTPSLAITSAVDEIAARNNSGFGAAITNLYDYDRSGLVNAVDQLIARNNAGTLTKINLADPPAAPLAMVGLEQPSANASQASDGGSREPSRPIEMSRRHPGSGWGRNAALAAAENTAQQRGPSAGGTDSDLSGTGEGEESSEFQEFSDFASGLSVDPPLRE